MKRSSGWSKPRDAFLVILAMLPRWRKQREAKRILKTTLAATSVGSTRGRINGTGSMRQRAHARPRIMHARVCKVSFTTHNRFPKRFSFVFVPALSHRLRFSGWTWCTSKYLRWIHSDQILLWGSFETLFLQAFRNQFLCEEKYLFC